MSRVELTVRLSAPADAVWAGATSMAGINDELWPALAMRGPPGVTDLSALPAFRPGEPLFGAWVLLGAVLPVDRMRLTLTVLEPRRFVEESPMLAVRQWRHERFVVDAPGGCALTDRLDVRSRVPGTDGIAAAVVRALFTHRHRRLVRRYGAIGSREP